VDNFVDRTLVDQNLTSADINGGQLRPRVLSNTLKQRILQSPKDEVVVFSAQSIDLSSNFNLLDPNVQKTGNVATLKYDSIGWLEQPLATRVENVNPFHVIEYVGNVKLSPESDFWIRTIYIPPSVRNIMRSNTINNTMQTIESGSGSRVRKEQ